MLGVLGLTVWKFILPLIIISTFYHIIDDLKLRWHVGTPSYKLKNVYDFIVVGAGTAGSVVASRLSENPAHSVLLIEEGDSFSVITAAVSSIHYTHFMVDNFKYDTKVQGFNCQAYIDRNCQFIRGRQIGGTAAINSMFYIRGNARDYDNWEKLGNPGWSFKDVLPYFKKLENNTDPTIANDTLYHSTAGPIKLSSLPFKTQVADAFLEAARELGHPVRNDLNGRYQTGFANPQGNYYKGIRYDPGTAYIMPYYGTDGRQNLHVTLHTEATKILLDQQNRAYGVNVIRHGVERKFYATKEIIVCTGALVTPKLLKLSGIGPALELQQHQIRVRADLPVGLGMMSHVGTMGLVWTLDKGTSYNFFKYFTKPEYYKSMFKNSSGPLAAPAGLEGIGFLNTKYQTLPDFPDVEALLLSSSFGIDAGIVSNTLFLNIRQEIMNKFVSLFTRDAFSLYPILSRPKSRGVVLLASNSSADPPLIIHNVLSHPDDIKVLIEGIRMLRQLGDTIAFKKLGADFYNVVLPDCKHLPQWSDAYTECWIRTMTFVVYHDVGTAKMGPPTDGNAVVDPELRVYGVPRLRVVDASVMPYITSGNTMAPVIMIGEKASDLIKHYWHQPLQQTSWPVKINNTYQYTPIS